MKFFLAILIFFSGNTFYGFDHAIYISVIEVHSSDKSPTLIKIKVFKDDLQSALRNDFPETKIGSKEEINFDNKSEIDSYFQNHFQLKINNQVQQFELKNIDDVANVYWVNFEIQNSVPLYSIYIETDIFTDLFPTQSNIINVNRNNEKRFAKLTKENSNISFSF